MASNASQILASTTIKMEDWQLAALGAPATEFQELTVKLEPLQSLEAESSKTVPVTLIPQTYECLKAELILDDELPIQTSHSEKHKPDIPEKAAGNSFAEEGSETNEYRSRSSAEILMETQTEGSFKCGSCPRLFKTTQYLRQHIVTHAKDRRPDFTCQLCGRVCYNKGSLQTHMKSHTGDTHKGAASVQGSQEPAVAVDVEPKTTVNFEATDVEICKVCHISYRKESMQYHMRMEHIDRPYKCELCPRSFTRSQRLKEHLQLHVKHGTPKFTCHLCSKNLSSPSSLQQHIRLHTGDTFKCKVCDGRYTTMTNLRAHMRRKHCSEKELTSHAPTSNDGSVDTKTEVPSDEEFLEYDEDARSAGSQECTRDSLPKDSVGCELHSNIYPKNQLSEHIRLAHHGQRYPYKCELCTLSFTNPKSLRKHMRTHVEQRKPEFACHLCSKKLSTYTVLQQHIRLHTGDTFNCKVCDGRYTKKANLNLHMRYKHPSHTQQHTSGPLPPKDASVDTKKEFSSAEEFLEEPKGSDSAQEIRKSVPAQEDDQLGSVTIAYSAAVKSEHKNQENFAALTSADAFMNSDEKQQTGASPQTSNEASVQPKTELMSDEEFLDIENGTDC